MKKLGPKGYKYIWRKRKSFHKSQQCERWPIRGSEHPHCRVSDVHWKSEKEEEDERSGKATKKGKYQDIMCFKCSSQEFGVYRDYHCSLR